ncbi:hypothetical protein SAMN02927921_03977 [Sinomicrobium oceani]|uniref:Anti-sigma factor n=1 Tax=Sinomicrobium oceani TaxID=1150368 RepID=A0A1K1RTJ6_9FLAO|nr:hypothetical protein [Sinomicrobium oceani]SFW75218.1 hypothetical protein SAMN02927921_03977 [Sinomicrobium oceani]
MKDIRELLEKGYKETDHMPEGHEERFLDRLDREIPPAKQRKQKETGKVWKIAASFLLLGGVAAVLFYGLQHDKDIPDTRQVAGGKDKTEEYARKISLGDLSPDLKKVEEYYVTAINWELSQVEVDSENKQLFDEYMARLGELNKEYQALNRELNDIGPNEQTVVALIDNLKLRLELLYRLKNKLQELKSKNDEKFSDVQV